MRQRGHRNVLGFWPLRRRFQFIVDGTGGGGGGDYRLLGKRISETYLETKEDTTMIEAHGNALVLRLGPFIRAQKECSGHKYAK